MITQINLQTHFGGGEVYTNFLCQAFNNLQIPTKILVHQQADFWGDLNLPSNTKLIRTNLDSLTGAISDKDTWLLGHGALPSSILRIKGRHLKTAIAHMPIQGRNPESYRGHDMVFPVSTWVKQGLEEYSLPTWRSPLYGVANLTMLKNNLIIKRTSKYDWDDRKVRDLLFGKIEPFIQPFLSKPKFIKKPGITLGIVSRITPIKQFPLLFSLLSKILSKHPKFNLEIFGSGGYASVRDLKKVLYPIRDRVRFWGHQSNVSLVYKQLDYLITGLPEKEALGLNIIEAQTCGVPVLAPNAPPFTETIMDNHTGFLYTDPRIDNGESFDQLLKKISSLTKRIDPTTEVDHLNKFSLESFTHRIGLITNWVEKEGYL
ncbi:glycosyltransferase [Candidatus Woesearchaeota archaeon]|nr:glycosyltransferase [bacterium]MBT7558426.1 glycosyltransferase [Candidatus Woesearchaeota archaeon]